MINCGGIVDIEGFFQLEGDAISVYVIDSHRPYALANVRSDNTVVSF